MYVYLERNADAQMRLFHDINSILRDMSLINSLSPCHNISHYRHVVTDLFHTEHSL